MPTELLIPVLLPLILKVIDHLSPADAEALRQKLNDAVDRRKAEVRRNEDLDATRGQ